MLVVEDDAYISDLIADVLQINGFEVDTAENGAVALAMLRQTPTNMIVLDLMMPVMNGWEFMRQCQYLPDSADRRILVISAGYHVNIESFGGSEFLSKPFEMKALVDAVSRMAA